MLKAKFEVTTAEQTKQIAEQTKTISADQNINQFLLIHKKNQFKQNNTDIYFSMSIHHSTKN